MKNQQYQYLCLVEELRKRLQDGELQSGSAIPSEAELAKALSLSKREVRPLLKNLEIAGILSGSRDGTYTLAKEMSDSMRELMHVMFLVQNISPFEVCQMRRSMELSAFPMAYARRDHLADGVRDAGNLGHLFGADQFDLVGRYGGTAKGAGEHP